MPAPKFTMEFDFDTAPQKYFEVRHVKSSPGGFTHVVISTQEIDGDEFWVRLGVILHSHLDTMLKTIKDTIDSA